MEWDRDDGRGDVFSKHEEGNCKQKAQFAAVSFGRVQIKKTDHYTCFRFNDCAALALFFLKI